MLGHREGGPATAFLGILQHGLNTTPKAANSKLWEPEMRKLFCQRGSLTFIWKDTLELGGGQVGKPFQAKDSMCRGGEAGENVVLRETTAKCRARVSTVWERRIKKRGRVQIDLRDKGKPGVHQHARIITKLTDVVLLLSSTSRNAYLSFLSLIPLDATVSDWSTKN